MKTTVITGATSGIGKATLLSLINQGHRVIGIGRSAEKINECLQKTATAVYKGQAEFVRADLSSQREIRTAADQILKISSSGIDCLINNAGSFASSYKETEDALEWQFAVNHIAVFLMTRLLLPVLKEGGRIITVGSSSHFNARLRWKDPQMKHRYSSLAAYRQSKFFNVLMTNELNRLYSAKGINAYIADPGLVNTEIGLKGTKGLSRLVWSIRRRKGQSVDEGASTSVYLATNPDISLKNGCYYKYSQPLEPDKRSCDPALMKKLWKLSESFLL